MKTLVLFAGAASFAASVLLAQDAQRPNAPSVKSDPGRRSCSGLSTMPADAGRARREPA